MGHQPDSPSRLAAALLVLGAQFVSVSTTSTSSGGPTFPTLASGVPASVGGTSVGSGGWGPGCSGFGGGRPRS